MTQDRFPVTEDELHAFVDGELPQDRQEAVTDWIATHPEAAALVNAWRAQADAIRARYGAVAEEPVPRHLTVAALSQRQRSWKLAAIAAAAAAFIVGGALGWFAHGASASTSDTISALAADAIDAYKLYVVEVRHPVEVSGDERPHMTQWLSRRVGTPLHIPDLQGLGLKLVGGRLLPGPGGAAAFYLYENAAGERISMYCARGDNREAALRFMSSGQVAAIVWADKNVAYAVSGPANRERLESVARTIYDQLESSSRPKS